MEQPRQSDLDAIGAEICRKLHMLRPAAEYRETQHGYVLWWWLPVDCAPSVGILADWEDVPAEQQPSHWSPLPLRQLIEASDGVPVFQE